MLAAPFVQTGVAKRPNFLVFLTGRQTHNAWSGCGNSWLKTPAMDSIARRGNVFTNAVCPYPVCSASRSSIFTGRMPHETGVRPALTRFGATAKWVRVVTVNEQMAGLIYVKGHLPRRLEPGLHAFWPASGTVRAELGTLRVNIPAEFRIADPMLAARTVRNPGESLYRLLQLAVRRMSPDPGNAHAR